MKTIPIALETHAEGRATTLAFGMRIERTDGAVFGFTSASVAANFDGIDYLPSNSLVVTNIDQSQGLAVDNLELSSIDDGSLFTQYDVENGVWHNAKFRLFKYNWKAPTDGTEPYLAGTFGEVERRNGVIVGELRGLQQYLQQPVGNVSTKNCRARFADFPAPYGGNMCRLNPADYQMDLVVSSLTSPKSFAVAPLTPEDGDPYWSSVILMVKGEGPNLGTIATDLSNTPHTCTLNSGSYTSTTDKKFGTSSLYFTGSSSALTIGDSPDISFTGDFTIECFFKVSSWSTLDNCLFKFSSIAVGRVTIDFTTHVLKMASNTAATNFIVGTTAVVLNTWNHVALVRSSGVIKMYLNGIQEGVSYSYASTINPTNIWIGAINSSGTSERHRGYIDEVRISSIARYLGVFSPPTAEFYTYAPAEATLPASGWFDSGLATWTSGNNNSASFVIDAYDGTTMSLLKAPAGPISVGDTLAVIAGCKKRLQEDCRDKFSNAVNFQGEPHRPGVDLLTAPPKGD